MKWWTLILLVLALACPARADTSDLSVLKTLPVQEGGRLKPLDTVAREAVRQVTGKSRWQGEQPVWTLVNWWAKPEKTLREPLIEVRDLQLKARLRLAEERWFSFDELQKNSALSELREVVHEKSRQGEELSGGEDEVARVLLKMRVLKSITEGRLAVVPHPEGLQQSWATLADLEHAQLLAEVQPAAAAASELRQTLASQGPEWAQQLRQLGEALRAVGPVPTLESMQREVRYNQFHPFRKAWVLYLVAFLLLLAGPRQAWWNYGLALGACSAGLALHGYGFFLRCMIAGRPPVTNMYESVIWVAFGAVLFSVIFESLYRAGSYMLAASGGAVVCLILADNLPTVLDPSIDPLTPVLRSNFWLTLHVLTITLGYAAFLLGLGLAHMVLWRTLRHPEQEQRIASGHEALYKSLQLGVLLLAAGTILGGVWANYSWGRFWGWDPKEVWALIALLGYLAILHGRYAGWLRRFGMAAWSIVAFQGVLMAWYGVNYVLGAGLHSYGFGSGGVEYVAIYVLLELAFVAWVSWRHSLRRSRASH